MSGAALALVLALAAQAKAPQGAGTVWLTGWGAPPASERPALLLVAAPPDSPAPLHAAAWGGGADSEIVDVRADLGPPDVAILERVRHAQRLLLGPGDLTQWRAALWDGPRPSALARALREAWGHGAEVAARGAGALLLGDAYLDVLADAPPRNPRAAGTTVARPGLGLCAGVTLDGPARGVDLRPLVERVLARDTQVALWLSGPGGARYEPDSARWVRFGEGSTLAFDARTARHASGRVERVLVEWFEAGRPALARDPLRLSEVETLGQVEVRTGIELWNPRHWMFPPGERRTREGTGTDGRLRLVGLPEDEGLAPGAWLTFEP